MKLQSKLEIVQGDTAGIWKISHIISAPRVTPVVRANLSAPGYSCSIRAINDSDGSQAVAERAVTVLSDDNFYFLAALFPAETASITPGMITVGLQLSNPTLTPPLRKERQRKVWVQPNINSNA